MSNSFSLRVPAVAQPDLGCVRAHYLRPADSVLTSTPFLDFSPSLNSNSDYLHIYFRLPVDVNSFSIP